MRSDITTRNGRQRGPARKNYLSRRAAEFKLVWW